MRNLTPEECEFIAGGRKMKLAATTYDPETIVVTGSPPPPPPPPYYPPPPPPPYYPPPPVGGGGGGGTSSPPPVGTVVPAGGYASAHVHIQATHLTTAEAKAVSDWEKDLNTEASKIGNLPDNAKLTVTLYDSSGNPHDYTVTGQELKSIFNSMQYNIVDDNSSTGNMTNRGSAQWVNGVPTATFTGAIMQGYETNQGTAGLDYLALHEIAHLTQAGQQVNTQYPLTSQNQSTGNPTSEYFANTVANAEEVYDGLPTMSSYAPDGADTSDRFVVPAPAPAPSGGGGGGYTGGAGGGGQIP